MRIDKFLKVTRLIKRRETAKELCDDGDVLIAGKKAKPMTEIHEGDIFVLSIGKHKITAKVMQIREFAKKEDAAKMYEVLNDEIIGGSL